MGSKDDNLNLPTGERMASLATSQSSARSLQAQGSAANELGQQHSVPLEQAKSIVEQWPAAPKSVAATLLEHYGPPNEATPTKLLW